MCCVDQASWAVTQRWQWLYAASSLLAPASLRGSKVLNNALCRSEGLLWAKTPESAWIQILSIVLITASLRQSKASLYLASCVSDTDLIGLLVSACKHVVGSPHHQSPNRFVPNALARSPLFLLTSFFTSISRSRSASSLPSLAS
jgi:hypothetical protein